MRPATDRRHCRHDDDVRDDVQPRPFRFDQRDPVGPGAVRQLRRDLAQRPPDRLDDHRLRLADAVRQPAPTSSTAGLNRLDFVLHNQGGPEAFQVAGLTVTAAPPIGGVPEPTTWAMMVAGFGLVGVAVRRRSRDRRHRLNRVDERTGASRVGRGALFRPLRAAVRLEHDAAMDREPLAARPRSALASTDRRDRSRSPSPRSRRCRAGRRRRRSRSTRCAAALHGR